MCIEKTKTSSFVKVVRAATIVTSIIAVLLLACFVFTRRSSADYPDVTYQSIDGKIVYRDCYGTYTDGNETIYFATNIVHRNSDADLVKLQSFDDVYGEESLGSWKYVFACRSFLIYSAKENSVLCEPGQIIILRRIY